MSFTLTLERSVKPRDKSMAVNCESYYMTWKCVTTYTGVYWIWEIISLKALFKVKLSWQMQSFQKKPSEEFDSKICARPNDTLSAPRIIPSFYRHLIPISSFMSRLETYRWELSNSSFCVGVVLHWSNSLLIRVLLLCFYVYILLPIILPQIITRIVH